MTSLSNNEHINKILTIASESRVKSLPKLNIDQFWIEGACEEIFEILSVRNGFCAFESALKIFPWALNSKEEFGVVEWNAFSLWKHHYGDFLNDIVFFAEDGFACQFGINCNSDVFQFDPETAELSYVAKGINLFFKAILEDYDYFTGYSIIHDWQATYGALKSNQRLIPKIPFVLGGSYHLDNMAIATELEALSLRGKFFNKIKFLKDGVKYEFDGYENDKSQT